MAAFLGINKILSQSPPPLRSIIKVDYLAAVGAIAPVAAWGLFLLVFFFDAESASFFAPMPPIITVAGLLLLFWRVSRIRSLFVRGKAVPGIVSRTQFHRGAGSVQFAYANFGRLYVGRNLILQASRGRTLKKEQVVTVLLDPQRPHRALIRDLYLSD